MANAPQENAIGVDIVYTVLDDAGVAKDISLATDLKLIITKANGARVEKTAVFVTDGTDGKLKYVSVAGDLSPHGTYEVQADFTLGNYVGPTQVDVFDVLKSL